MHNRALLTEAAVPDPPLGKGGQSIENPTLSAESGASVDQHTRAGRQSALEF